LLLLLLLTPERAVSDGCHESANSDALSNEAGDTCSFRTVFNSYRVAVAGNEKEHLMGMKLSASYAVSLKPRGHKFRSRNAE